MIDDKVLNSIDAGLALLPSSLSSPQARTMLYAIGLQESRMTYRRQIVNGKPIGPAKGLWQFERGGGCRGVLEHPSSRYWMHRVCVRQNVPQTTKDVWDHLEHDDAFAAAAARLLLFTDPKSLPAIDDADGAWNLYIRTWRPGKPHRKTWDAFHQYARQTAIERADT